MTLPKDSESRKTIVTLYARRGFHCRTAELIYEKGVPAELQRECDAARAAYLAKKAKAAS